MDNHLCKSKKTPGMMHELGPAGEDGVPKHARDIISAVARQEPGEKSAECRKKTRMVQAMIMPRSMQPVGDA